MDYSGEKTENKTLTKAPCATSILQTHIKVNKTITDAIFETLYIFSLTLIVTGVPAFHVLYYGFPLWLLQQPCPLHLIHLGHNFNHVLKKSCYCVQYSLVST